MSGDGNGNGNGNGKIGYRKLIDILRRSSFFIYRVKNGIPSKHDQDIEDAELIMKELDGIGITPSTVPDPWPDAKIRERAQDFVYEMAGFMWHLVPEAESKSMRSTLQAMVEELIVEIAGE